MRDNKVVAAFAGLVAVGALIAILLSLRGSWPPRINPKPHQAVGWTLAQQALGLLERGGKVTVITRDTTAFKNPATDIQLAALKKALHKGHATIGSLHVLQVDPLRPVEVPPGDFLEIIRNSPKGSVIVSLMGPPMLTDAQCRQLSGVKPAIVAFCPGSLPDRVDLRALFEQGLLQVAVVSRSDSSGSSTKPRGLSGWFDRSFQLITAEKMTSLWSETQSAQVP